MAKKIDRRKSYDYEDEWGEKPETQRKRYDKVRVAIKKARTNKRKQRERESTLYGD